MQCFEVHNILKDLFPYFSYFPWKKTKYLNDLMNSKKKKILHPVRLVFNKVFSIGGLDIKFRETVPAKIVV